MAKRLQEIIEETGLNRREARVYLAVLQRPEATLAEVVRATLIPRMSCYEILRSLLQKGFVDVLIIKKRRRFVAVHPQKVHERLARRAEEFRDALPRLERYVERGSVSARIRFFEGKEGIRAVFRRILDEKRPFLAITCIDDMEHVAKNYFEEFIRQRFRQHLKVRLLTNRTPASIRLKKKDAEELRETRFVPREYGFHTAEYIFGDTLAILSLKENPCVATIIEDPEIAKTHAMYFDLIWKMASSS